jgi:hypothetical protein
MSGRPKNAPKDPAEEREQLRQLTRELHEAAQHARDAARELRDARQQVAASAIAAAVETINRHQELIGQVITANYEAVQRTIENQERQTREHYAALLGTDGAELILRTCGQVLHLSVPTITAEAWMEQIRNVAAQHERTGCHCTGCLTAGRAAPRPAGAPRGQILVGTAESIADYIAKGGDPGIVLDARS